MRVTRRRGGDRGNISVLFAVLLLGVFGVGAMFVDVGTVYVEGRQLQNGAENAALAVARTCATGTADCDLDAGDGLANANALDGATEVEKVCGTGLPAGNGCSGTGERARFGCRPLPSPAPQYVQVQTRSLQDENGSNLFPGYFYPVMTALLGTDYDGTEVRACARAAFGTPGGLTSELPLAISTCEFDYWRKLFGLVEPPYPAGSEAVLYFHDTGGGGPSNCPNRDNNSNQDTPGGFGWLQTAGSCQTATTSAGDATEKPGNNVPADCQPSDFSAMLDQIVRVPIYSLIYVDPATNKPTYDIINYAAFHLTGYRLSGNPAYTRASPTLGVPCPASSRCISGYFTVDPAPTSGPLVSGPSFGAVAIKLVG